MKGVILLIKKNDLYNFVSKVVCFEIYVFETEIK